MIRVINVRKEFSTVYLGREMKWHRQSPWHNPFHIGPDGDRQAVIEKFAVYFYAPEQKWLRDKAVVEIPFDAVLGCWCTPFPCHAEIVAGYLNWKRVCYPNDAF